MGVISLSQEIIQRLEAIAERENRSPEDVVASLLERYTPPSQHTTDHNEAPPAGTFARFIYEAEKLPLDAEPGEIDDTSARSREILETEFADYLLKRMDKQETDHAS